MTTRPTSMGADRAEEEIARAAEPDAADQVVESRSTAIAGRSRGPAPVGNPMAGSFAPAGLSLSQAVGAAQMAMPEPEFGLDFQATQVERRRFVDDLTISGLAWSGMNLSEQQAEAVASAMWVIAGRDPEFRALVDEDLAEAFNEAAGRIEGMGDGVPDLLTREVWDETLFMMYEVAGDTARRNAVAQRIGIDPETGLAVPEERKWFHTVADSVGKALAWATEGYVNVTTEIIRFMPQGAEYVGVFEQAGREIVDEQRLEMIAQAQLQAKAMVNPSVLIAGAAAMLVAEHDMTLATASDMAREAFAQMSAEEQAELLRTVEQLTAEELVEQVEGLTGDGLAPEDAVLTAVFDAAAWYDAWTHSFGTVLIDATPLAGLAADDAVNPIATGVEEGFDSDAFAAAFEEMKEGGIATAYFGLEAGSAGAGWLNLGASIVFDPTTWIAPTPRRAGQQFTDIMSDVGKFDAWSQTRKGQAFFQTLARDDPALNLMMTAGMRDEVAAQIFRSTDPTTIQALVREEITGGSWLMDYHALAKQQRAVTGFANYAQRLRGLADGDGIVSQRARDALDWVVDITQRTDERRVVDLGDVGASRDVTALLLSRFRNDPDRLREWANRWFDTIGDTEASRLRVVEELRSQAQSVESQIQTVQAAMDPFAQAAGRARNGVKRLPIEIDKLQARIDDLTRAAGAENVVEVRALRDEVARLRAQMSEINAGRIPDDLAPGLADEFAATGDEFFHGTNAQEQLARTVERMQAQLDEAWKRLDPQAREAAKADFDAMRRTLSSKQALLARYEDVWSQHGPAFDAANQELVNLRKMQEQVVDQLGVLGQNRTRAHVRKAIDDFYDEWATDIGVPLSEKAEMLQRQGDTAGFSRLTINEKYDWNQVRGLEATDMMTIHRDASGSLADTFGDASAQWQALDVQDPMRKALPASAQEMILWETLRGNKAAHRRVMRAIVDSKVSRGLDRVRQLWTAALLFNPITPIKSNLDEVFTFAQDAGVFSRDTARAFGATVGFGGTYRSGSRAERFVREVVTGTEFRTQGYRRLRASDMPKRGAGRREYIDASKRFLEGTVLQQDILRAWARAYQSGDWRMFEEWFVTSNRQNAIVMGVKANATGMLGFRPRQVSAREVFEAVGNFMESWSKQAPDSTRFHDGLVEILADGTRREVPEWMAIANPYAFVENGNRLTQAQSFTDLVSRGAAATYDTLYGGPSRRRGGVFFDHYFDRAKRTLEARYAGRIVNEADVIDRMVRQGVFRDAEEAAFHIRIRDPRTDAFLREHGFITSDTIDEIAYRWAKNHAESLMYVHSASSALGKAMGQVFPFGAASADFLRRWTGRIGRSPDFITGPQSIAQRARIPSTAAHMIAEEGRTPDDADPANPIQLMRDFTFLPLDFNDGNVLIDLVPGLGPIPTNAIHLLPDDDPRRLAFERMLPSLEYLDGQLQFNAGDMMAAIIPNSGRSVPALAEGMVRWAGTDFFGSGGPILDLQKDPAGLREQVRAETILSMVGDPSNGITGDPFLNVDSPEAQDVISRISTSARRQANSEHGRAMMFRFFGARRTPFVRTHDSFTAWERFMTDPDFGGIESLRGLAGNAQLDQFRDLWEKYTSTDQYGADMTREEIGLMSDVAAGIIWQVDDQVRDQMVAWYPELAVLMVGTVQGARDRRTGALMAPDQTMFLPDGRINRQHQAWQGDQAEQTYEDGFNEGWLEARPEADIVKDVYYTSAEARRRVVRQWWEQTMGEEWRGITSTTKGVRQANVVLSEEDAARLERWGITGVEAGMPLSGEELHERLGDSMASWSSRPLRESPADDTNAFWAMSREMSNRIPRFEEFETEFEAGVEFYKDQGIDSFYDWPEEGKAWVREQVGSMLPYADDPKALMQSWSVYMSRAFGPLDGFEPPTPPPVDQLDFRLEVPADRFSIVDGDTLEVATADGEYVRVRLVGLNAPEQGTVDYDNPDVDPWLQARQGLRQAIAGRDITIGIFDPDVYGTTQVVDTDGTKRIFAWLYVDGRPLYDPSVFTATSPTGVEQGGVTVPDYQSLLNGPAVEDDAA